MKKREFCIILGSALLAAGVSGCKESASKKYSSAQELINKGEYGEAVKKLREITSYEDSSQLLLYASANAAAVEGSFSEAITTLQSLGDYKDSQNLIVYYSAKQAEAQEDVYDIQYIASLYESIPLFRDSKEQEEAYLSGWYKTAVTDAEAENYAEAYPIFDNLGSYNDSDKMIDYYEARRLEAEAEYEKAEQFYAENKLEESEQLFKNLTERNYQDSQKYLAYVRAEIAQKNKDYNTAIKILKGLQDYKDSKNLLIYYEALEQSESKQVEDIQKTVEALKSIPQVKDSNEQLESYQKTWYDNAIASGDSGEYDNAIKILEALKSYEDSSDLVTYYKARRYEFKDTNDDRMRAIAMYEKIPEVKDSKERKEAIVGIQEGIYAKAEEQLEADKFFDAKETFQSLGNYSDAKQRVKDTEKARQDKIKLLCANQRYAEALHFQNLQVGDVIKFGEYEQDNNLENGREAIDWIVLEVQDDQAFVLSEKCLDARIFSETREMSEWTDSNIRNWLNGDFMQTAFSSNLQDLIVYKEIKNERDPYYAVSYGEGDTLDYVFLLSYNEAIQYLKNKTAYGTLYACEQYNKKHTWMCNRVSHVSFEKIEILGKF